MKKRNYKNQNKIEKNEKNKWNEEKKRGLIFVTNNKISK